MPKGWYELRRVKKFNRGEAEVEFFSLRNSYQPEGIYLQPSAEFFPKGIHIIPSDELFTKIFSTARAQKNKVLPKERILLFVPSDPETSFRQISKANIFSHHVEIWTQNRICKFVTHSKTFISNLIKQVKQNQASWKRANHSQEKYRFAANHTAVKVCILL